MKKALFLFAATAVSILSASAGNITITFRVPDGTEAAYIAKVSNALGYETRIRNSDAQIIDNPESREEFCKRALLEYVASRVRSAAANEAAETARKAAESSSNEALKAIRVE